jgi:hypothetical protein
MQNVSVSESIDGFRGFLEYLVITATLQCGGLT